MNSSPIEVQPFVPRVGRKNRPPPELKPRRPYQETLAAIEEILARGGGPGETTVLVAKLAKETLAEQPLPPAYRECVELLDSYGGGWHLNFYLFVIRRRACALLEKMPPGLLAKELGDVKDDAAERDERQGD